MSKMSPSSSSSCLSTPSRWCPTPEQVMILEEIYRNGLKTPNATQIQHITSHLSFYGKIEGKNVFYWFQNHKARDRQKLRRKLYKQLQLQHHHQMLVKRHRFDEHQFLHYFLPQQRVPQQLMLPNPGAFIHEDGEREEASTARAEWGGGDRMMAVEEGGGSLRTLELFPVRGSCVKEEENGSGSCGNNNGLWRN